MTDIRKAAEQLRDQLATTYPREYIDLDAVRVLVDAALAAEQPQPEAQPVAVVTECEACFTPDVCQLRGKCDHYSTDWLRVAPPPAAPEPSEAEVEAACAVYDALGPTTDRGLMADALRAAAAARNTNPA